MFGNHVPYKPSMKKPTPTPILHKTIQGIFKRLFKVTVKASNVMSIEEQREYGVLSSGDKKIDKAAAEAQTPILITINDMVEYYREGIPFRLTGKEDSKIIYELVTDHTARWRNLLRHAMNIGDAPVEDLILMEKFVATIYDSAKFTYYKKPEANAAVGSLGQFLYSGGTMRSTTYVNNKLLNTKPEVKPKDIGAMTHQPDIDTFRNAIVANMRAKQNES